MFYEKEFPFSKTSCEVFVSFERKGPLVVVIDSGKGKSVINGIEEIYASLVVKIPGLQNAKPRILQRDSYGEWSTVTFQKQGTVERPQWAYLRSEVAHREIHLHTHPLHLPGIPRKFYFALRDDHYVTNVAHRHKHHSSTGIAWGYVGAGPRDLALNILALFIPLTKSSVNYRVWGGSWVNAELMRNSAAFMNDFIAPLEPEGGTIDRRVVRAWLRERRRSDAAEAK
jgi:hypothetical protein